VKGISDKLKCIVNPYNIRSTFKTKHTLRGSLMKTLPETDLQQMANILCECGRPLAVWLHEHRHNLTDKLLEKSKLAQHAYEEGHRVGWDEARIFETESNSRYRKYNESAHMACLTNPISQHSVDICPIWIPLIRNEVSSSQGRSV
jgi:hypothetical protein